MFVVNRCLKEMFISKGFVYLYWENSGEIMKRSIKFKEIG